MLLSIAIGLGGTFRNVIQLNRVAHRPVLVVLAPTGFSFCQDHEGQKRNDEPQKRRRHCEET